MKMKRKLMLPLLFSHFIITEQSHDAVGSKAREIHLEMTDFPNCCD